MDVNNCSPRPPADLSDTGKDAWLNGYHTSTGSPDSDRAMYSPFPNDEKKENRDAWNAGWEAAR